MTKSRLIIGTIGVLAIVGAALLLNTYIQTQATPPQQVAASPTPTPNTTAPSKIETSLLFSGDVFWSRATHYWAQNSSEKFAHPFGQLHSFRPENYDGWIANLECPITTNIPTKHDLEVLLKFNCQPEYVAEAAKFFDAFSLATNHTDNQNEIDGFTQTKQYLSQHNIDYFGHYDNKLDEICRTISFPARVVDGQDQIIEQTSLPIALCGYHYVFRTPRQGEIEAITAYARSVPTIAIPHMGEEYTPEPDQLKQSIYRRMVDAGAIAVVGSHPHWVQITEAYKGKLIAYSLGNFIFDQRWNDELMKGAVLTMNIQIDHQQSKDWINQLQGCQQFDQPCLDRLSQYFNPSAIKLSYDVMSADSTSQQTTRGNTQLDQWLLQRMRWEQTLSKLK